VGQYVKALGKPLEQPLKLLDKPLGKALSQPLGKAVDEALGQAVVDIFLM
jgi:hypothetical protein